MTDLLIRLAAAIVSPLLLLWDLWRYRKAVPSAAA